MEHVHASGFALASLASLVASESLSHDAGHPAQQKATF
jgi:hypothetical protein